MFQQGRLALLMVVGLCWLTLSITDVQTIKVFNLIPQFCSQSLETQSKLKEIQLKSTGNDTFVQLGASVPQGVDIVPNYKCFVIIQGPPGTGLVLTVRKASLNDNDTITFKSGTNPERVWKQNVDDEFQLTSEEIVTVASKQHQSTISVKYVPTVGVSPFNAGFDLAVTAYKEKENTCGGDFDFDCQNGRCISNRLRCDTYDNCGNSQDESGCGGISWIIVAILIVVAILVVVLAILVWVRMSKA